eukprot:gene37873-46006_t
MASSMEICNEPLLFRDAWEDAPSHAPPPTSAPMDNILFFGSTDFMYEIMEAAQGRNWIHSLDASKLLEKLGPASPNSVSSAISPTSRSTTRTSSSKSKAFENALFIFDTTSQDPDPATWLRDLAQACAQARQVLCLVASRCGQQRDCWAAGLHGSLLCAER